MKINLKQAVRAFFQNPSLEMVFIEAIANSLDAYATSIHIQISINSFSEQETLQLKITDNGEGFTDERYKKFCELLMIEEESHKGVGRLVYLAYFDKIFINSQYGNNLRTFTYDENFDTETTNMKIEQKKSATNRTEIVFSNCSLQRLASKNAILPENLRKKILEEFLPRLYLLKKGNKGFSISFNIQVADVKKNELIGMPQTEIKNSDIPDFETEEIDCNSIQWYEKMNLKYAIVSKDNYSNPFIITALCIDNRTYVLKDVISEENIPKGYELIFLLESSLFNGQVDTSRQNLTLDEVKKRAITKLFRDKIAEVICKKIPSVSKENQITKQTLNNNYPHLLGYFEEDEIGIISKDKSIEIAQKKFLRDQKSVLEANSLDDQEYEKAVEISSRTLAEYIVYREKIINKIENITTQNSEADIHNIILPKRAMYKSDDKFTSKYNNNLWLLDNKYMTYTTAMSERTMQEVISEVTGEKSETKDSNRPDIAIIFSDDPQNGENSKVDVVIVELKKRGIKLAKIEEVISQLRQRARKLMAYYPNKIQRIWFYGIVELTAEFRISLKDDEYTPLFSKDHLYYKENKIYLSEESSEPHLIGTYILSIDAFIKDARAHNETFLNILKEGFLKK